MIELTNNPRGLVQANHRVSDEISLAKVQQQGTWIMELASYLSAIIISSMDMYRNHSRQSCLWRTECFPPISHTCQPCGTWNKHSAHNIPAVFISWPRRSRRT